MIVYILVVENEIVGVYDDSTKAYNVGCSRYGIFDVREFEVE